ncbi:MAG TPA: hypothetical protein VMD79_14900 [Solirubrobacteraceae bacterium]|nr:hypothetical protein [Solirubrobacteraceae bacterium]
MHGVCQLMLVLGQLVPGLCDLMLYPCQLSRQARDQPGPSLPQLQLRLSQLLLSLNQLRRTLENVNGTAIGRSVSRHKRKLEALDGAGVWDLRQVWRPVFGSALKEGVGDGEQREAGQQE